MPTKKKHPGGRPRKFSEPSQPVTVTLPARTLAQLARIDRDRARAIVRTVDLALPHEIPPHRLVEVATVAPDVGMLVVPPSRYLKKIKMLRLVEVAPSRFLLTVPTGTALSDLEIALVDLLEDLPPSEERERAMLAELHGLFRRLRRGDQMSKAEILFVAV
jgi:hypothetical protein